ncbi:hypothetical protein MP638_000295 [Amoeboaphelidium occidentale]|nr:hypothetical protein MP638_000295 [Amoeboaphelidium occidentale]
MSLDVPLGCDGSGDSSSTTMIIDTLAHGLNSTCNSTRNNDSIADPMTRDEGPEFHYQEAVRRLLDIDGSFLEQDITRGTVFAGENSRSNDVQISTSGKKSCRCGWTDLQKTNSKKCPMYKGTIADRNKTVQREETHSVIKSALNQMLTPTLTAEQKTGLIDAFNDNVHRSTDIYVEALRLLNGFVLWCIENNRNIPNLEYGKGIMHKVFLAVQQQNVRTPFTRKAVSDIDLNIYASTVYGNCRPASLAWCDASGISSIIQSIAKQYSVNCMNHLQLYLSRIVRNWVQNSLRLTFSRQMKAKCLNALVSYIMKELSRKSVNWFVSRNNSASNILTLETVMQQVVNVWDIAVSLWDGRSLCRNVIKKQWSSYLKHIPLSIIEMYQVVRLTKFYKDLWPQNREQTINKAREFWIQIINVEKHERCNRRFGYHVCSNGVEIGVQYLKSVVVSSFDNHGYDEDNKFHPLKLTSTTRAIGLDPGRASLYVAADGSLEQQEIFKCSNSRWREISGSTHGFQKRRNWNKKNPYLQSVVVSSFDNHGYDEDNKLHPLKLTSTTRVIGLDPGRASLYVAADGSVRIQDGEISGSTHGFQKRRNWNKKNPVLTVQITSGPSHKVSTTAAYCEYLRHVLSLRDDVLGFYRDPKWRRLRFKTRITRQKAYETLARELTDRDKNCIVAYGSGGFISTSKGHSPTPNKHLFVELKKRCRVRLVSDQLQQTKFWGIKKCNNHFAEGKLNRPHYLTLWNRDINAARNIRYMFLERNLNGDNLPEVFKKKEECAKEKKTNRNSNGDNLPEVFKKKEECAKEKKTNVSKTSELSHVPSQPHASGSSKSSVGLAEAAGEEIY